MVIGPKELTKKIVEKESKKIKELEERIDKELESRFNGYCIIRINRDIFQDIRECTIESVLFKYNQAGWFIEYVSTQRDREYYIFKPKEEKWHI